MIQSTVQPLYISLDSISNFPSNFLSILSPPLPSSPYPITFSLTQSPFPLSPLPLVLSAPISSTFQIMLLQLFPPFSNHTPSLSLIVVHHGSHSHILMTGGGGGKVPVIFMGLKFWPKSDFLGFMKDAGVFLGRKKNRGNFWGLRKRD